MNELKRYIDNENDSRDLVTFLREYDDQELLFNFYDSHSLLYDDIDEKEKAKILLSLNLTKNELEKNRRHARTSKDEAYDIFKNFCDTATLSKNDFNNLMSCILGVSLKHEKFDASDKAIEAINDLKDINESAEEILKFLHYRLKRKTIDIAEFKNKPNIDFDKLMEYRIAYSKISSFGRSKKEMLDLLSIAYNKSTTDEIIESEFVIQFLLNKTINNESIINPLLIINPNNWLIRKWILNNPVLNRRIIFALKDKKLASFYSDLINDKKYIFTNFNNLEVLLNDVDNRPTDILFYSAFNLDISDKTCLLDLLFNTLGSYSRFLYFYDEDSTLTKVCDSDHFNMIDEINIIPSGIPEMNTPKRRSLTRFNFLKDTINEDVLVKKFYFNKRKYSIESKCFKIHITKEQYGNEISLRQVFRNKSFENEQKSDRKRNSAIKRNYSDDIYFYYTISGNEESDFRVKAYFRDFKNESVILEETILSKRFHNKDDIEEWLSIYPYQINKEKHSIQEIVSNIFLDELKTRSISLKTFIYVFPDIINHLPDNAIDLINTVTNSYLGTLEIGSIRFNDIEMIINNYLSDYPAKYVIKVFSSLFDYAFQKGYCGRNILKELKAQSEKEFNEDLFNIRQALTKKHFSKSELSKLTESTNNIKKTNYSLFISTLLRLSIAIEPNIICALKWKDLKEYEINNTKFYSLIVRRQLSNDGSKISGFNNRESYRIIPIPSCVSDLLIKEREHRLSNYSDQTLLQEESMLFPPREYSGDFSSTSPKKLYSSNRSLINKIINGEEIIKVPDNNGGFIETNLEHYTGDFFKTNLYHYGCALNDILSIAEYNYIVGNKQEDTFYSNYCDFSNSHLQLIIYNKIEKTWREIYG